jgi:hypothetical protein
VQYLLLIYEDDAERIEKMDERMPHCAAYVEAMKKAGIYLLVLVAVVSMHPSAFRIVRTLAIQASPEVILPHITSLRAMDVWSPWVKLDPKLKVDYAGPGPRAPT